MDAYHSERTKPLYRASQVVWFLMGCLQVLLAFRFVMKLAAANPAAAFSSFMYNLSQPFVWPFENVFRITRVEGNVFEWTTLLAMAIYWLIAYAIIRLLVMGKPVSTPEAAIKLEQQNQ